MTRKPQRIQRLILQYTKEEDKGREREAFSSIHFPHTNFKKNVQSN